MSCTLTPLCTYTIKMARRKSSNWVTNNERWVKRRMIQQIPYVLCMGHCVYIPLIPIETKHKNIVCATRRRRKENGSNEMENMGYWWMDARTSHTKILNLAFFVTIYYCWMSNLSGWWLSSNTWPLFFVHKMGSWYKAMMWCAIKHKYTCFSKSRGQHKHTYTHTHTQLKGSTHCQGYTETEAKVKRTKKKKKKTMKNDEKVLKQSLDSIVDYKLFEPNFPVGFYSHSEAETNR